jgi:hypothetical protein
MTMVYSELGLVQTIWQEIKNRIKQKKDAVFEEIVNYPPPIPACDVQFNFLLAERARLSQELKRVKDLSQKPLSQRAQLQAIEAYIVSSTDLDDEVVGWVGTAVARAQSQLTK